MKGKKLVFAVILSLIVCLLLVPSAYAEEQPTENNSDTQIVDTTNTDTDGDNGGSDNDSQNNESTDKPADSGDSESKNDSDNDSTSDDEGQSGANDGSSDEESKDDTTSDDTDSDNDSDTDESNNDSDSEEEESDTDSEEKEQENASEEETETDTAPSNPGDSNLPPQPDYTGFQVELTYNGKIVKMNGLKGGESHDFAQLMKELGIEGEVESAIGDADDLFNVTSDEKGMHFNTLMAFETKQKLVVTVGGVEYVIIVTDDGAVKEVANGSALKDSLGKDYAANVTLKLTGDCLTPDEYAFTIDAGKTVTIDLNGHTIKSYDSSAIKNSGNLRIIDSSLNKSGKIIGTGGYWYYAIKNYNTGVAVIEGGTLSTEKPARFIIDNDGQMTLKDGVVILDNSNGTASINNGGVSYPNATMTIEGGNYSNSNGNLIRNVGVMEIKDGSFSGKISKETNDKLTICGGTFTDEKATDYIKESDVVEIKDGKIVINPKVETENTIILNEAPVAKYFVVEGEKQEWTKSSNESLTYTLNSSAVVKVTVNGVEVEFTVDEDGNIIISAEKLSEILAELEEGEYDIVFIFADGSCKTKIILKA